AITSCNKIGGYLITNNQWMTIARSIENISSNWSTGEIGVGNLYNGVSNSRLGCNAKGGNIEPRLYVTRTGAGIDETCNNKRNHKIYNGKVIWDFSGNVWEHVNKANTYDGSGYNINQTTINSSSALAYWDDDGIYAIEEMDEYGSKYYYGKGEGMGSIYYGKGVNNNIFVRGSGIIDGVNTTYGVQYGIFSLTLNNNSGNKHSSLGFRCVTF
ncbi:MAG: hypothetical protein Q9M97_07710, partial [Candidatus Gracilibacteria bacterium]|nr:hypothetical protein [Candidatus Gracilibacteria bacterium]